MAEARASAPLTGTLPFKAGARAHPAPPFGGARGGGRTGSRELTCRRGAKEPGARARGREERRREGGRRRGRARALGAAGLRRRLLWRSRPEPPPSSPLLSSCSPAAAGPGPGGSMVSPGRRRRRRGMQTARRGLALAVGLGRAPSPAAQYGRAGGAEGRGVAGSALGTRALFQAEPDRGAQGVAPPAPSASSPGFLEMWRSLAPALQHVRARGVIPWQQMLLGAPFLPPRLWGSAMGGLFLRCVLLPRAFAYPRLGG